MAQASVTLKALGLKLSPNQLELPPGSMSEASNVIIRRDNVVQSRRGYKLYSNSFGSSSDYAKQLISYKDTLIRHYNSVLQFQTSTVDDNGAVQFSSFAGSYDEPEAGIRIKSVESNGNLYFTTTDGIKKISSATAAFSTDSGFITSAGGVKAIDFTAQTVYENGNQSGSLQQDTAVRYQIVWGIKDANSNLILGTPSPDLIVTNNLRTLLIKDLNYVLHAIDQASYSGGTIGDHDYYTLGLPSTATGEQIRIQLDALEAKLTADGALGIPGGPAPTATPLPTTHTQLVALQAYLSSIIVALQGQAVAEITAAYLAAFISPLDVSTSSDVQLNISIPTGVTTSHFYQVYRSAPQIIDGSDSFDSATIAPTTELQLAYEGFPTSTDITNGYVTAIDSTPDTFLGAFLYTNAATGEGSAQANDPPPVAKDINRYKNVVFYANTKTKQQMSLNLLGITRIVNDSVFTIASSSSTNTYTFKTGVAEVRTVTCDTFANTTDRAYVTVYSSQDKFKRWFWFEKNNVVGSVGYGIPPTPPAGFTTDEAVMVYIASGVTTAFDVRLALASAMSNYNSYWTVFSSVSNEITITNASAGVATDTALTNLTGIWAVVQNTQGQGGSGKDILLSSSPSPSIATQETALDIVRAINSNSSEIVYAYYTPPSATGLGTTTLIARNLNTPKFYILGEDSEMGISFTPDISPSTNAIVSVSAANPTVITTTSPHGLETTNQIIITGSNTTPNIDGIHTITKTGANTFTIPVTVTVAGTAVWELLTATDAYSSNEERSNRVYYSKYQEPEAVPLLNYFDVGAQDKAILRIFPLRDSLFVFKEDGLYRISGEASPFVLSLFDVSCILLAPDSLGVANNLVYGYTRQGISVVSEAGTSLISRDIDTLILKTPSLNRSVFNKVTWGVGYESDNSYTVYTVKTAADTKATIAYRYSNLTNTWTTFDKTNTCGIVSPLDDKLYMGAGDTNYLEQERKSFDRTDFADREITKAISSGQLNGTSLKMLSVSDMSVGDVIVQDQTLSIYEFNMLLKKLDYDSNVAVASISSITTGATPTVTTSVAHNLSTGDYVTITASNCDPVVDGTYTVTVLSPTTFTITATNAVTTAGTSGTARLNYYETLKASAGANLRTKIEQLATKLDGDPGIVNTDYLSSISAFTAPGSTTISSISAANPAVVTVGAAHNLFSGRIVTIAGTATTPSLDGTKVVTVTSSTEFTVPVSVTVAGITGTVQTKTDDFRDVAACYNHIVVKLNADSGPAFNNYTQIDTATAQEAVITAINLVAKEATLNVALDFVIGSYTVYKAIDTTFTYSNITLGDPLNMKQIYESTLMFDTKTFTQATLSFSTDLLPEFKDVSFVGQGNGIFGNSIFGGGFFGGLGHSAPFRTYIPQQCQRCRFINVKYTHQVAREMPEVYGLTLVGNTGISNRAYR